MASPATAETKEASAETVKNIDNGIQVDIDDNFQPKLGDSRSKFAILSSEAKEATDAEHVPVSGLAVISPRT